MDDSIALKLGQLGLDRRGVVSPMQKAMSSAIEVRSGLPGREPVLSTRIAGFSEPGVDAAAFHALEPGNHLSIGRVSGRRDLLLSDSQERTVGRLPRESISELNALVGAGEELSAQVTSVDEHDDWVAVGIDIFARKMAPAKSPAKREDLLS